MKDMKVLIIYAHPNPKSFNHALLESFTDGLKEKEHSFETVDLYDVKFDPCTKIEDLVQFRGGQMPREVLEQQEKVRSADGLVFIFPRWDWTYPAILKGWIQRVFTFGFAYKVSEKGVEGLLHHDKALLINTTGGSEEYYKTTGLIGAFEKIYNTTLRDWSGIKNVENVTFYSITSCDDKTRKEYLEKVKQIGKEF
jgi:NAD(P)H dehydrogenase (quinone)